MLPAIPGYEILAELGRGSMGVVYKARQFSLNRLVALKMILADHHPGQEAMRRFITEAQAVASLLHPNIVQVYEINLEIGVPYYSMELVEGGTLADQLRGWPQPARPAAQLLLTLARTIHVAHQNGIIHRDLKPSNVLLARAGSRNSHVQQIAQEMGLQPTDLSLGRPKITDFGLAKQMNASGQTESGMIVGTPGYMAPEQAEGKSRDVGPAADVYALGAIFYELLTGRPPFAAESPLETVLLLFQLDPIPPSRLQPRLPRDLETICLKCLEKQPSRRYPSAEALAEDLQRFLASEPIQARPPSLTERVWKWSRRRPALATLAACFLLALLSGLGGILWHQGELRERLGQAIQDERRARQAEEVARDSERLSQRYDKVKDLLRAGEAAIAASDFDTARVHLTSARNQVHDQPELAELQTRIDHLLQRTEQQRRDQQRWQQFRLRRNDALFHASLYTGSDVPSSLQEARHAAREALALFGIRPESPAGPTWDSPFYSPQQQAELRDGCYELLLVLAEAVAQQPAEDGPDGRRRQAIEALRILDRAAGLGLTTQAYHRRRAHYLVQAGQQQAAEQQARRAQELRPSTPLGHFLLGLDQYLQEDFPQAIVAFENALQTQPDHFWASYYLALCWLKTQHPQQAAAHLTACLSQWREFPYLYLLRASAWGELGQAVRAEDDFAAALQAPLSDSARYGLLINRGVLRLRHGQVESARADLQQAIALRPHLYHGYVNLAQAHLKKEQLDEAIAQLDEAIRREPGLAALYRTRARVHLLRKDQTAALADLDEAIKRASGNGLAATRSGAAAQRSALAEDHLERARLLLRRKDFPAALAGAEAILALQPRDPRASRLRAEVLLELNRMPEALQALDDCLSASPTDVGAFRARAALRTRLGQYAGAQTDWTRALELEPDAASYAARGWCYLVANAPRLALPDFEEAIRRDPDQGDTYAGRGYALLLTGQVRPAIADAEEALRRGPSSSRLHYNVARIYAQAVVGQDEQLLRYPTLASSLRSTWQERAMSHLNRALELLPPAEAVDFWHNVVQTDQALNPIRGRLGFPSRLRPGPAGR